MEPTKIETFARAKGMTQETLAYTSKVTISTVRRLWQDRAYKVDPKIGTLRALARVLEVDINDLGYSELQDHPSNKHMSLVNTAA
ncbi:MAG: helix-turn-helix transcriptional regulator [Oscillochloridaceae bacterium umkhey_bin13]